MSFFDNVPDIEEMIEGLENTPLTDFIRWVGRQLQEEPDLKAMPFRTAFSLLVGRYALALVGHDD